MQPHIKKSDLTTEFYIDEGCYITELSNSEDDPDLSIARARVKPGVTTNLHKLTKTVERYVILEGQGTVVVGDLKPSNVVTNDIVIIPSGCAQSITNTGEADLIFLAICTPRFQAINYEGVDA